jgi:hypothetical protein
MSASSVLHKIPKPILFGMYGALGGLIGALFFGEPAWAILKPPPPPASKATMAISVSPSVQVYQGQSNRFTVQAALGLPPGATGNPAVKVAFENVPAGMKISDVSFNQWRESAAEAEAGVTAADSVPVGLYKITAKAVGSLPGTDDFTATDTITVRVDPSPMPVVDVMFVLDITSSMQFAINGVRDGIKTFAGELAGQKLDFRVGLLAFRDRLEGEEPQILKFGQEAFTKNVQEFTIQVDKLKANGGGDEPESSMDAIDLATRQNFRDKAIKVLILITDAPPKTPDKDVRSTKDLIERTAKRPPDQLHIVAPKGRVQDTYDHFHDVAPGKFFDLTNAARNRNEFNKILPELSKEIAEATRAARPDQKPQVEQAKKPAVEQSLQSNQQFAEGSGLRLLAFSALWSALVAAAICFVLISGQHHYLRSSLPGILPILLGLGGGFAVGLLGGLVGQGFYSLGAGGIVGTIFQVIGWMLLGGLAGAGLSFFVPNLKWYLGSAGGVLGGFIGVLAFLAGSVVHEAVGRLFGALILGGCIGAMVALVEAAFRKAWLEVKLGPRETITVNLGPEPVKIGSDSKNCTVWAKGAAPVALRYFVRNGQVICHDVPGNVETTSKSGETRKVGPLELTVMTGKGNAPRVRVKEPEEKPKPVASSRNPLAPREEPPRPLAEREEYKAPPPVTVAKPVAAKPSAIDALFDPFPAAPMKPKPSAPTAPAAPSAATAKPPAPSPAMPRPPMPAAPTAPAAPPPAAAAVAKCQECGAVIEGKPGMRICKSCGAMS